MTTTISVTSSVTAVDGYFVVQSITLWWYGIWYGLNGRSFRLCPIDPLLLAVASRNKDFYIENTIDFVFELIPQIKVAKRI